MVQLAWTDVQHCKRRLSDEALRKYRKEWVDRRKQWKIDERGRGGLEEDLGTDLEIYPSRLMSERARLTRVTSGEERRQAIEDLGTMLSRDYTSLHLPGEGVKDNRCPRQTYDRDLSRYANIRYQ